MDNMIENDTQIRFVIKVDGQTVSEPYLSEAQALHQISNLPQYQQPLAEVVPITSDGKTLLLEW
jgi:hypothetical protein